MSKRTSVTLDDETVAIVEGVEAESGIDSRSEAVRKCIRRYAALQTECDQLRQECDRLRNAADTLADAYQSKNQELEVYEEPGWVERVTGWFGGE